MPPKQTAEQDCKECAFCVLKVLVFFSKVLSSLCLSIFFCCESTPDNRPRCYACLKSKHALAGCAPFCCIPMSGHLCRDSGRFENAARLRAI